MKAFDQQTLDFYSSQADTYSGHRPDQIACELPGFLQLLAPQSRILELGCGGGIDAAHMIALGFDVEPTDGVAKMAAIAETRLGRAVRVMRFEDLDAVEIYNAVIAVASLLHVPVTELSGILSLIWQALKPGGWHIATYKTRASEGRDKHGRYYNYLSQADAAAQYLQAGEWLSVYYEEYAGVGYFSEPAHWLKVVAQKAG